MNLISSVSFNKCSMSRTIYIARGHVLYAGLTINLIKYKDIRVLCYLQLCQSMVKESFFTRLYVCAVNIAFVVITRIAFYCGTAALTTGGITAALASALTFIYRPFAITTGISAPCLRRCRDSKQILAIGWYV